MTIRHRIMSCVLPALFILLCSAAGDAAGLYTQLVLPFSNERAVTHSYVKQDNALIIAFPKTKPNELSAFDHYDERLIKRVVMTDLGPIGTEVKLVLRDKHVRATVNQFQEPFRVIIDLFDAGFAESKDPQTGMPLAYAGSPSGADDEPGGIPLRLLNEAESDTTPEVPQSTGQNSRRRLMQALPSSFSDPQELDSAMRKVPDGLGRAWNEYPPYIYRLHTAPYEAGLAQDRLPSSQQALTSMQAMADFAGKLFNMGHEQKALIAYQQVLLKEPAIFDKDALHLWKFSETHLAQGNLTLARGYYETLLEKHPESPLAPFARLRILDLAAIHLIKDERLQESSKLASDLATVKTRGIGEAAALVGIRKAYWTDPDITKSHLEGHIPSIQPDLRNQLTVAIPNAESPRTKFLASTLIMGDIVKPNQPWQRTSGPFADSYFRGYKGKTAEPYTDHLKDQLQDKLNKTLQTKVADGKLIEAINDYEALPNSLRSIRKTPATAWALAEAYRKLEQGEKAVEFYQSAAKDAGQGAESFKANYWLSVTAGSVAARLKQDKAGNERVNSYTRISRDADRKADAAWSQMTAEERNTLSIAYKESFEQSVSAPTLLRTAPKIVLSNWTDALATRTSATTGDKNDWQGSFSPSGSTVILLTDLARRFQELGLQKERREALNLLRRMKPSEFDDDKVAKDIWTKQLVTLAEEHRKASEYLDAGRIYSQLGEESENWEGRAEALYKGGLLLFRSGRRDEAIAAFTKASEDGNNMFYANLAKERLAQLN